MMIPDAGGPAYPPGSTGRTLVLLEEGTAAQALEDVAGVSATPSAALGDGPVAIETLDTQGVVFGELGVAVVDATPDQVQALAAAVGGDKPILGVEAERIVYALDGISGEYVRASGTPRWRWRPAGRPPPARVARQVPRHPRSMSHVPRGPSGDRGPHVGVLRA